MPSAKNIVNARSTFAADGAFSGSILSVDAGRTCGICSAAALLAREVDRRGDLLEDSVAEASSLRFQLLEEEILTLSPDFADSLSVGWGGCVFRG